MALKVLQIVLCAFGVWLWVTCTVIVIGDVVTRVCSSLLVVYFKEQTKFYKDVSAEVEVNGPKEEKESGPYN